MIAAGGLGYLAVQLYLLNALFWTVAKGFKYRQAELPRALYLDDYRLLVPLTALPLALLAVDHRAAAVAVTAAAVAVVTAWWADALLFRLYGFELEPAIARAYLPQLAGFRTEAPRVAAFLGANEIALLPLAALAAYGDLLAPGHLAAPRPLLLVSVGYLLLLLLRSGPRRDPAPYVLALMTLGWHLFHATGGDSGRWGLALLAALAVATVAAGVLGRRSRRDFFVVPSSLRHLAGGDPLPAAEGFRPRPEHRRLLEARPERAAPSAWHGRLAGANVVLVTLEGIGRDHLALYREGGADTPYLAALARRSLVSSHHFCISPNTTNAHHAIYSAGYPSTGGMGWLPALRAAGYRTLYLTPSDTHYFGHADLLRRAGFDQVVERRDFHPDQGDPAGVSDVALAGQGVALAEARLTAGGPFFLHLQTANTHSEYHVVDGERFGRFGRATPRARFLNSLEEADWLLESFAAALGASRLAGPALWIVTADHGQAFGELNYRFHSNAVIKEEINVPFLLHHPALDAGTLSVSSHLDILPTVFDLLGLAPAQPSFGASLLARHRQSPPLLLYSEARRGVLPANFGLIEGSCKTMFDLVYQRYLAMDWDDRGRRTLAPPERAYYASLFRRLLALHGLDRSTPSSGLRPPPDLP